MTFRRSVLKLGRRASGYRAPHGSSRPGVWLPLPATRPVRISISMSYLCLSNPLFICCSSPLCQDLLDRPVENLLMNQANRFREFQERREFLNQGYRVGSEFWSLPQRYGDEMSGLTATLTQTEQGRREPVTHVGQPSSIRQESGTHRHLRRVPIFPFSLILDSFPSLNIMLLTGIWLLLVIVLLLLLLLLLLSLLYSPTLIAQGEVGISSTIFFEALTGETASSHLELHNEGSTAIFYSWHQLPFPHSFPNLQSQTMNPQFYFNSSSGVILPGETQLLEFIFKSEKPGIKTELWQLNTHPMLLQGASMQVTLKGVALYQDKTADQRLFVETKLEKIVTVKMCQSIVYEVLRGVLTPERPSSPAELYITEVQTFRNKNPKLRYLHQPVEDLKRLWQEVNPGHTWDLSVDTLRQVETKCSDVLHNNTWSLQGKYHPTHCTLSVVSPEVMVVCGAPCRQMLWKKLLDTMAGEAMRLRNLLGLPERETWIDKKDESPISDSEKKGGAAAKEERSGARSRFKDDSKRESKSPTTEKSVEVRGKDMCVCEADSPSSTQRWRIIKCFATERQQIHKYFNYGHE
uniref:Mycbp associated protein n=1 Tax=Seriola lalandi dorsalis TaxID=1841481 RepID=A0A3B4XWL1_SERLL